MAAMTLPVLMKAATVASVAFSAIGAIQQGNAAKAQADYQATIAEQNAEISKQQTQAAVERQDRERRMRLGANIAGAGASGVGLESFGDILSSSAAQEELDLLTLKSEGLLQQRNFMAESSLLKSKGKQAQTAGYMTAASEVLGGASSLYKPSGMSASKKNFVKTAPKSVNPLKGFDTGITYA